MKKNRLTGVLVLWLLSLTTTATAQDFSKAMSALFGKDYPKVQWFNYPIDNYGVATTYRGKKDKPDISRLLCGTFSCLGVASPSSTDFDAWIKPNDFVEIGCGSDLDAKVQQNKKVIFNAVLPKIAGLLGLSGGLQSEMESSAEITKLAMCDRRLQQERMINYITGLRTDTYGMQRLYNRDELVLVVLDLVLKELQVNITAKPSLKASLDAALQGKLQNVLGDKASLSLLLEKKGETTYTFAVNHPVIAGSLAVRKGPGRGVAGGTGPDPASPWDGWITTTIPSTMLKTATTKQKTTITKPKTTTKRKG